MHSDIISWIALVIVFLASISLVQEICKRIKFPFVVALLILGLLAQYFSFLTGIGQHLTLSPEFIFLVLLPLLLFGSALHINLHQFKLQLKTITFLATFGLLVSITIVGGLMALVLGLPLVIGLLFGAIISATDPIAVLAIFKNLGAPKRLSLLADGESMFNDATAVIVFRALLAIAVGASTVSAQSTLLTVLNFGWVFIASILSGSLAGLISSLAIEKIDNDLFVETTFTVITALLTFLVTEHYMGLSGVISTVVAGLVVGNLGTTKISGGVTHFLEQFWDYIGTAAVAVVFFFAAFELNVGLFVEAGWQVLAVIVVVLLARAISVYVSMYITNKTIWFNDEPNVSWRWQHVLNWGGLRGVIPLVLVFSLPDEFIFKSDLLLYTLAVLLFSLLVNGTTIQWLLVKLQVHLPTKQSKLLAESKMLLQLEELKDWLSHLPDVEVEDKKFRSLKKQLRQEIEKHKQSFIDGAKLKELEDSLTLQALSIERKVTRQLYLQGVITEPVFYDVDAQLDLQQDALEYPDVFVSRVIDKEGQIDAQRSFRFHLRRLRHRMSSWPVLRKLFGAESNQLILERYLLLKTRLAGNQQVMDYFDQLDHLLQSKKLRQAIRTVRQKYKQFAKNNKQELTEIVAQNAKLVTGFHQKTLDKMLAHLH